MASEVADRGGYRGRGLHGVMVERLGQRIVAGQPSPGEALPQESDLGEEYDVSRTVVREALRVLAAKGLVDARPMRGTRVRPRAEWRLLDSDLLRWALESQAPEPLLGHLLEIRRIIEPQVARLAAERSMPEAHARLEAALDALVASSGDVTAFIESDLALHDAIIGVTGNPLLGELVSPIGVAMRLGRQVQARGAGPERHAPAGSLRAHRAVVLAIIDGDGDRAEAAMRRVVAAATRDAERALGHPLRLR